MELTTKTKTIYIIIADGIHLDNPKIWTNSNRFWCLKNHPAEWSKIKTYKTLAGAENKAEQIQRSLFPSCHKNIRVAEWENVLPY